MQTTVQGRLQIALYPEQSSTDHFFNSTYILLCNFANAIYCSYAGRLLQAWLLFIFGSTHMVPCQILVIYFIVYSGAAVFVCKPTYDLG